MNNLAEDNSHLIIPAISSAGKKFSVGYPKADGYSQETLAAELESGQAASALAGRRNRLLSWMTAADARNCRSWLPSAKALPAAAQTRASSIVVDRQRRVDGGMAQCAFSSLRTSLMVFRMIWRSRRIDQFRK